MSGNNPQEHDDDSTAANSLQQELDFDSSEETDTKSVKSKWSLDIFTLCMQLCPPLCKITQGAETLTLQFKKFDITIKMWFLFDVRRLFRGDHLETKFN